MNLSSEEAFFELSYYTLSHKGPEFIHQYIVDAYAAQTADENTKTITIAFALIGLYLHVEKGFTGKHVQQAHMQLAKYKDKLPSFILPKERGDIGVFDVLQTPEGVQRDEMIEEWMGCVWGRYTSEHSKVL